MKNQNIKPEHTTVKELFKEAILGAKEAIRSERYVVVYRYYVSLYRQLYKAYLEDDYITLLKYNSCSLHDASDATRIMNYRAYSLKLLIGFYSIEYDDYGWVRSSFKKEECTSIEFATKSKKGGTAELLIYKTPNNLYLASSCITINYKGEHTGHYSTPSCYGKIYKSEREAKMGELKKLIDFVEKNQAINPIKAVLDLSLAHLNFVENIQSSDTVFCQKSNTVFGEQMSLF